MTCINFYLPQFFQYLLRRQINGDRSKAAIPRAPRKSVLNPDTHVCSLIISVYGPGWSTNSFIHSLTQSLTHSITQVGNHLLIEPPDYLSWRENETVVLFMFLHVSHWYSKTSIIQKRSACVCSVCLRACVRVECVINWVACRKERINRFRTVWSDLLWVVLIWDWPATWSTVVSLSRLPRWVNRSLVSKQSNYCELILIPMSTHGKVFDLGTKRQAAEGLGTDTFEHQHSEIKAMESCAVRWSFHSVLTGIDCPPLIS